MPILNLIVKWKNFIRISSGKRDILYATYKKKSMGHRAHLYLGVKAHLENLNSFLSRPKYAYKISGALLYTITTVINLYKYKL